MITRILKNTGQHFLLLGPRQCGKSTWCRQFIAGRKYWEVDLLSTEILRHYTKNPSNFFEEALYQIRHHAIEVIFIDEIQKIPELLNEVHRLLEHPDARNCQLMMSGSSARKLRRGHANLMGGRALLLQMFPFVYGELQGHFQLERALQLGLVCGYYFDDVVLARSKIKSYIDSYLKEEIMEEGIIRNLPPFYRFLDLVGQYVGEIVNYANLGREAHTSEKTIKSYFSILEDTLLGFFLPCYDVSIKRSLAKHTKFYLFDNGIACGLAQRLNDPLTPQEQGKLFEQFIINEVRALISYYQSERKIYYWRTTQGHEVDLLITHQRKILVAIEIKCLRQVGRKELAALEVFSQEHPQVPVLVVALVPNPYQLEKFTILPWQEFLQTQLLKYLR